MASPLAERLRALPRAWVFAAVALAAAAALLLMNGHGPGGDAGGTDLERRMERILSAMEGVGEVRAMITQDEGGEVRGVLIVCGRMDGLRAALRVRQAVQALLDVPPERVSVVGGADDFFGMEEDGL